MTDDLEERIRELREVRGLSEDAAFGLMTLEEGMMLAPEERTALRHAQHAGQLEPEEIERLSAYDAERGRPEH